MKETTINKDSLFAFVCQINSSTWMGQILSFFKKFYLLLNIINNSQEHIKNYLYLLTIFLILMKGKVHSSFYKLSNMLRFTYIIMFLLPNSIYKMLS